MMESLAVVLARTTTVESEGFPIGWILGAVGVVIGLVVVIAFFAYGSLYIRALLAGCRVSLLNLVGMRLRGVNPSTIVDARIMAVKAGLPLETNQLETHFLARGNVLRVVMSLIAATKANIKLSFEKACAIDLAGRDVLDAVRTSVNPRVIDCPSAEMGRQTIDGVAKDGIQLRVKARVTVRTNIDRLVGGATEQTIVARVGEGIVATIGAADTYAVVLENPDRISKTVLGKALDAGTAFEILSIDIADVDVGENVGAKLQEAQAEANKNMAQAQAEIRRAAAVALEQEMKAKVQEMQAKVVEAQAQVPMAMAEAFRQGKLGVMDYYRMENIQSDTAMRGSIAHPEGKK